MLGFGERQGAHIGAMSGWAMIATAVLIDSVQFFLSIIIIGLVINPVISFVAMLLFGLWLSHNGLSVLSPKYAARFLFTFIGEVALGFLPIWTVTIVFIVGANKLKEIV